jgi:uncharacterized protein (TIGR04255 family)
MPVANASESLPISSAGRRHYAHAPVLEAVIEIRVAPIDSLDIGGLAAVRAGLESEYPHVTPLVTGGISVGLADLGVDVTGAILLSAGIRIGVDASNAAREGESSERIGYKFGGGPNADFFQTTGLGLSYHKLTPYTHWEACRARVEELWSRYRQWAKPVRIARLGLRYVNRLELPAPGELTDYLLTAPRIAPGLPQVMSSYLMQISIPQPDMPGAVLNVRQGILPAERAGVASIVVDHDLTQPLDISANSEEIWPMFERMHERQDQIFEATITDRTRELIS